MIHAYPRPQLERRHWRSLNGSWKFPLPHLELLIEVWGARTERLAAAPGIRYVLPHAEFCPPHRELRQVEVDIEAQ